VVHKPEVPVRVATPTEQPVIKYSIFCLKKSRTVDFPVKSIAGETKRVVPVLLVKKNSIQAPYHQHVKYIVATIDPEMILL
jgi:hypothetical protein